MTDSTPHKKQQLRQQLRHIRRALNPQQQKVAAQQLLQLLLRKPAIQQAQHIAFYWPTDGEISPLPLVKALEEKNKKLYLPVIHGKLLKFKRYSKHLALQKNRFGILEPSRQAIFPVKKLDFDIDTLSWF